MAVTGWFGWSVLWLLPLLWRLARSFLLRRAPVQGQGSIRLWLGTVFMLCASSALEALVRSEAAPAVGRFVGGIFSDAFGVAFGVVLLLATVLVTLPWLFGRRAFDLVRWVFRSSEREHANAKAAVRHAPASVRPGLRAGGGAPAADAWKLPATFFGKDAVRKPAEKAPPRNDAAAPVARPSEKWAPFEQIRPTSAMLARAKAAEEANARKLQREPVRIVVTPPRAAATATAAARPLPRQPQRAPMPEEKNVVAPLHEAAPPAPLVEEPPRQEEQQLVQAVAQLAAAVERVEQEERVEPVWNAWQPPAPSPAPAAETAPPPRIPAGEPFAFQPPAEVDVDLPGLDLLDKHPDDVVEVSATELAETGQLIEQRLKEFKVPATVLGAAAGPVITRFEIEPAVGVRGAQIVGLMKDLSRALGLTSIRVVETIPGKTCMGLELPNARRQMIQLSEMLASGAYRNARSQLTLAMGKDITGTPVVTDLARAPHMLVAGTTGSGKSVAINAMILSLLYKATPEDVRLIMIDPKMLELSVYDGIPHLLAPVVTDMKLAANALTWCVAEMEKRYRLMSALGVRNLAGFNQKIKDGRAAGKLVKNPFSLTPDAPEPLSTLPTIVVVIDELADLMMVAGKKIEELIARLAQKARAAGIHLILATQRPSVDVITGLIKANIPTRVAFQVSSKIDSRTVLDQMGAETLLGHGDMLFLPPGSGYPQRVHGAFVSDEEVHRVVEYLKQFGEPEYEEAILAGAPGEEPGSDLFGEAGAESDPLYDEAVAFVVRSRRASISAVQRQLRIGYNRAARLVEQMETAGLVSPMSSNGSRDVLVPPSSN